MTRRPIALLVLTLVLVPAVASARNSDPEYRFCAQTVMNNRENRLRDATLFYHTNWRNVIEARRQRLFDAWGILNDRDRSNVLRSIDTDARNQLRDIDRGYKDDLRNIQNDFRNDDRFCTDQLNQRIRNVPTGAVCTSSDQCSPPLGMCTTETGECRSSCNRNDVNCIQVCTGRCKLR